MSVEVERLVVTLEARMGEYSRQLLQGQQSTERALRQIDQRFARTASNVKASAGSMGAALGTIGTYLTVDQVVGYANAWLRVTRGLEGSERTFQTTMTNASALNRLASDARVDVEAYAKLYQRTEAAIKGYGFEADTAARVTSTLSKALKLGSANAAEQASALLQISQFLQKGKLDGDEFRTVMENAGVVQELLAKRLGVTKGALIEMAAAGKILVGDFVAAVVDGGAKIDEIFASLPSTIEESFVVLNNAITEYIGKADQSYGISQNIAGAMKFLATNIETVGDAALVAGVALLAMFAPALVAGVVALGAAMFAAAGPIGLVIGGLAGGAVALNEFGDSITMAGDGLVSLKDILRAVADELGDVMAGFDEASSKAVLAAAKAESLRETAMLSRSPKGREHLAKQDLQFGFAGAEFAGSASDGMTSSQRIAKRAREYALAEGFVSSTEVKRDHPTPKPIMPPADAEADRRRKKFDREYDQAARQIDQANAEANAVGRSAFETERLTKHQELLTAAREAGIQVTEDEMVKIDALSVGYARAVTQAETLRETYDELRNSSKEFLGGLITDLKDGVSFTDSLASALDRVANKLIDMAVNDLVETALGGMTGRGGNATSGGIGSALSSLFSGGGSSGGWDTTVTPFAKGGVAANGKALNLPRFANGGVSRSAAIFGEAGPEAAVPLPDGRRIPVDLRVPNAASAGAAPNVTIAPVFNVQNGTPEGVDAMNRDTLPKIRQIVKAEIASTFDRSARFSRSGI